MTIYRDLKAYLIDTPGFTWIKAFDAIEDWRGAYLAWNLPRHHWIIYITNPSRAVCHSSTTAASWNIFSKYWIKIQMRDFLINSSQVEHLLRGICMDDVELRGAKAVVSSQHANDFDAACL
jgi:hypothetical protein